MEKQTPRLLLFLRIWTKIRGFQPKAIAKTFKNGTMVSFFFRDAPCYTLLMQRSQRVHIYTL